MIAAVVRSGRWVDSARLMAAARVAEDMPGVDAAACFMGTPANLEQAREVGLMTAEIADAGPDDLVVSVRGEAAEMGLMAAQAALDSRPAGGGGAGEPEALPRSVAGLDADLALISVPGDYATLEAHRALGAGMDVMLFSDGVTLDDEVALKRRAHSLGRVVMGPGCGTAILDGIGLGFANQVSRGPVGVLAAAGTGAQEATVLLDRFGVGVSYCYGTGGRDLNARVGAITALDAIERLAADEATEVLLLVSKPPAPDVASRVLEAMAATGRPGAACLVGAEGIVGPPGIEVHPTIDAAVLAAARLAGARPVIPAPEPAGCVSAGHVRGLFSGGTLCSEAAAILAAQLGRVVSNAPAGAAARLEPGNVVRGHACIDLGEEEYTRGRPHPMIDPEARAELLVTTIIDQTVAV
ncbi:MAG: protein FdrA, partial [Actinomycetota bacterium]|nr:protein FdrA [Actinomycetota bacterium]